LKKNDFTSKPDQSRSPQGDGGGYRSRRLHSGRRERQRKLAITILIAGLLIALAAFLAVFFLRSGRTAGESPPDEQLEPAAEDSGSGNVILVGRGDDGTLAEVMVLAGDAQAGFSMIVLPARTIVQIPGRGFERLDRLYQASGQAPLDQAVADLLQVPIQYHIVYTSQALQLAAEQARTIVLKAEKSLTLLQPSEGAPASLAVGDNPVGSSMALALLQGAREDPGDGPEIQAAFWQGLRDALAAKSDAEKKGIVTQLAAALQTDMGDGFGELFISSTTATRSFRVLALPVEAAQGASGEWYFEPQAAGLMAMSGDAVFPQIELDIENGTDVASAVEDAALKLNPLGFSTILKMEPSGAELAVTQIRCGSEALAAANRVHEALGTGTIIKDEQMEKGQIIVIIGRDFAGGTAQTQTVTAP
jgi:hypothetical protein